MNIQPLTVADRVAWAELLAHAFERTLPHMLDLWDWLYENFDLIAWGAWDGAQLVAQYAVLIRELYNPATHRYVKVGLSMNMAVHAAYRGRGLIKQVSRPVYEQLLMQGGIAGVGFSNADGVQVDRHSKSYGYRVIGQLRSWVGLIKPTRAAPLLLSDRWLTATNASAGDVPTQIQFRNSPALLYRRLACHPFRTYHYGTWSVGDDTGGIVVYRPITFGGLSGVALLAAYPCQRSALPELLARLCAALRQIGVMFVHLLTTPTSAISAALHQSAIGIPLPLSRTPYYLTIKPLDNKLPAGFMNFSGWDCSGGDIL